MAISSLLSFPLFSSLLLIIVAILSSGSHTINGHHFSITEASVHDLQVAFKQNKLTSRQLVEFYLGKIQRLNLILHGVIIEVNPDVLYLVDVADKERKAKAPRSVFGLLHGIPILLKDNIATKDKRNTTAGSFALLGSVVPYDAGVVMKLSKAGDWERQARVSGLISGLPLHQVGGVLEVAKNPYVLSATPCSSSSGSAISVAANMVAVWLGSDTTGSIICPASFNSVVGVRPTVGLTSRAGVVPISPWQDTVGLVV